MTPARFATGDQVTIAARDPGVHHRVPSYAKGQTGTVERVCGVHGRPENFIRANGAPLTRLYRVRLCQPDVWPDYQGSRHDRLELEVFEHWLEPAA